ncbi:hypothetical protein STXM2123_4475 [Streptomyces sp. F-3]|nr:hypothetical protein STXM2123_4475 [Streptomyces sp. F-3]
MDAPNILSTRTSSFRAVPAVVGGPSLLAAKEPFHVDDP